MFIPKKLTILGHRYTVNLVDMPANQFGSHDASNLTIWLNKNISESQIMSTLLHEILESLSFNLSIGLEHTQLCAIEASLYQVLKDNNLKF